MITQTCILLGISLFCLWSALCVLCIGGWIVSRIGGGILVRPLGRGFFSGKLGDRKQEAVGPIENTHDVERDVDVPGLTWRDPTLWFLMVFFWPAFVAMALDRHFTPATNEATQYPS